MKELTNRAKLTKRQSENVRQQLQGQAHAVAGRLVKCALGEVEMTTQQVSAAKLILDKTVPTLAFVDQHVTNESPVMTEEQAVARLAQLLDKHPELARLLGPKGETVEGQLEH